MIGCIEIVDYDIACWSSLVGHDNMALEGFSVCWRFFPRSDVLARVRSCVWLYKFSETMAWEDCFRGLFWCRMECTILLGSGGSSWA